MPVQNSENTPDGRIFFFEYFFLNARRRFAISLKKKNKVNRNPPPLGKTVRVSCSLRAPNLAEKKPRRHRSTVRVASLVRPDEV